MVAKFKDHDPKTGLELAPAEYFRRNIWFTFENDRAGVLTSRYTVRTAFYGRATTRMATPHGRIPNRSSNSSLKGSLTKLSVN